MEKLRHHDGDQPIDHNSSASSGERDREDRAPEFLRPLAIVIGLTLLGFLGFAGYERLTLNLPFVREEPALFTPYYIARSAFTLVASGTMVWLISRAPSSAFKRSDSSLRPWERNSAYLVTALALVFTGVFLLSPSAFADLAQEDRPLEWFSALFLFAGSGLFAVDFLRRTRTRKSGDLTDATGAAVAAGFSILLFLIGMEEVSWMQRLVGFETPAEVAELNWQGEFNLHNLQTDLSETVYYAGAGLFLILLPLVREAALDWTLLRRFCDFLPIKAVAAASAPISIFNYGHWNLIPIQLTAMITFFVLVAYAASAARRGDRGETLLFVFLTVSVASGQAVFLAYGQFMQQIPNATEFKEFFIALGLACFAFYSTKSSAATGTQLAGFAPQRSA